MTMAAESPKPKALRRLCGSELFSSTRHHMGIYRAVSVSARYSIPSQTKDVEATLTAALGDVVKDQPLMRVGILDEDTNQAAFSHLAEINLRNHMKWVTTSATTPEEYESRIAKIQGDAHEALWPNVATQAPWRIIIVRPTEKQYLDIMFLFHHGLFDGNAGGEFHQHLQKALRAQTPSLADADVDPILCFKEPPELPESLEDAVPFKNTYMFVAKALWEAKAPDFLQPHKTPVWAGKPVDYDHPHITRIKPLDFSPDVLQSLLKGSRENGSTLTCTFHALILASISRRTSAEEAQAFASTTPISLRNYMRKDVNQCLKNKMRGLVTSTSHDHSPTAVSALRQPGATDDLIWQTARRVKADLAKKAETLPVDDVIGLVSLIKDLFAFHASKNNKPRTGAWEISNLGVLKQQDATATDDGEQGWEILRAMFSNGAQVSQAIGFNMISIPGKGLTIGISWQEGIVEDTLITGIGEDLLEFAARWHEEGRFLA
ncbi:alcohol acetyltransferase [Emericellopsis atlantica]|uniref:Alcohol acetyltransferase n=1 Tax=Emericellopsis atlantica TaxID=2614577 RepID=A0A9P8CN68_9HYPO|nr:alcohol acetyltransferase [Emericellopsis atlantica]KAG9253469.1 alcohol acetyltransferase [Emericellopsis atlantica]